MPSRPKHPAQPLALDVGSPRADLAATRPGKAKCFFSSFTLARSPWASKQPGCSHDLCAFKFVYIVLRLHQDCAVRERQAAGPSCFGTVTQGCVADGPARAGDHRLG